MPDHLAGQASGLPPAPDSAAGYYLRNPYEDWRRSEGVPVHSGFGVDCLDIDLRPWPRLGGRGAFVDLAGRGDYCDIYVAEIPPGGHLEPERHLYEETILVLQGRGTTTLELGDGSSHIVEWQKDSLFAIPLNASHQHANASGREPARLAAVTDLPIMLNVFHDRRFIFDNPFEFQDRLSDERYLRGEGEYRPVRPGRNQWETVLVPDLGAFELPAFEARGAGSKHLHFVLSESTMHAHMAEMPAGRYKKAHRHDAGINVFCVTGNGYSLLWLEGQGFDEAIRFDWKPGTVYAPPAEYFHQHFNLSPRPSRYLGVGFASVRYPALQSTRYLYENLDVGVDEGGTQIEFEDQMPEIHPLFLADLRRAGGTPDMVLPTPAGGLSAGGGGYLRSS
jgi:quercetin dioxygenase-like cupin family protein